MIKRASWSFFVGIVGIFLLITLLTGCITIVKPDETNRPSPSFTPSVTPVTPRELLITLERTACFGTCPVYSLTISGDGTVVYVGEDFVQTKGVKETTINENAINQLVSEFEKADYFSLNDSYTAFGMSDMPTVNTSILIDGKTKAIRHYLGDRTAPEKLTELENKIDEIINSAQWIE